MDGTERLQILLTRLHQRITARRAFALVLAAVWIALVLWNIGNKLYGVHTPIAASTADATPTVAVHHPTDSELAEAMRASRDFYLNLGTNEIIGADERLREALRAELLRHRLGEDK